MNKYEKALNELSCFVLSNNSGYMYGDNIAKIRELVEKEKPKKALYIHKNEDDLSPVTTSQCRVTGKSMYTEFDYCPYCGQKLDWR